VQSAKGKKYWIAVTINEGYFCLFLKAKIGKCQNYGGAGRINPKVIALPAWALSHP